MSFSDPTQYCQYYAVYPPQQYGAYHPQQHPQYNTHQNTQCPPQHPRPYVVIVPTNWQRQIPYTLSQKQPRYAQVNRDDLNKNFPRIPLEMMDLEKLKINGAANQIFRYFGDLLRREDQIFILNHLAFQQVKKGNYPWVSSLLMMKAEPYACNPSGESLLEYAQKYPSREIIKLIQKTKDSFIENALSDAQISIQSSGILSSSEDSLMGSYSQETTELTNEETASIEDSEVSEIESIQSIEDTEASDVELTSPKNVPNIDQIENLIGIKISDTLDTSPNSTRAFMSIPSIQEPMIIQQPEQTFKVSNPVYPHISLNTFSDSFENMMSS